MEDKALSLEGAKTLYNDLRSRIVGLSGSGESPNITVDSQTSTVSTNPVENRVITQELNTLESMIDSTLTQLEDHKEEFDQWKKGIDLDEISSLQTEVDTIVESIKKLDDDLTKDIQTNKTYIDTQVNSLSVSVDSKLSNISYNSLKNTPNLATVALSGNYDDLTTKPVIPEKSTGITETDNGYITGSMIYGLLGNSGSYPYDPTREAGYTYLPNGLLLQWGYAKSNSSHRLEVVYPISFTQAPVFTIAWHKVSTNTTAGYKLYNPVMSDYENNSPESKFYAAMNLIDNNTDFLWIALGY